MSTTAPERTKTDKKLHDETIAPAVTRRVVMTLGDKGGSSKSFILRKLAEMHLANNTPGLLLVDGDATVGTLHKFCAERNADGTAKEQQGPRGVHTFAMHGDTDARDMFVDDILQRGARVIIADMPATSLTILNKMAGTYQFNDKIIGEGYRATILSPITPYEDTIADLQEVIELFDPQAFAIFSALEDRNATDEERNAARATLKTHADYVAVVNLGMAGAGSEPGKERREFEIWDDASTSFTRRLLAFVGGIEIEFPALRSAVASKLAKRRCGFRGDLSFLKSSDLSRMAKFNNDSEAALHSAGALLGL